MRCIASDPDYTISVSPCARHTDLFRWKILQRGQPLDIDGYSYATRWMAERAGVVALECYLITQRTSSSTEDHDGPSPGSLPVSADQPSARRR
jgi:hypothetical protein